MSSLTDPRPTSVAGKACCRGHADRADLKLTKSASRRRKGVAPLLAACSLAIGALAPGQAQAATLKTLVTFNLVNGALPQGGLIADNAGNLLGTTRYGGATGLGTVFAVRPSATNPSGYDPSPTTLVSFSGTTGILPSGTLTIDDAGNLFGTTQFGGLLNQGAVFEIKSDPGRPTGYEPSITVVANFASLTTLANFSSGADFLLLATSVMISLRHKMLFSDIVASFNNFAQTGTIDIHNNPLFNGSIPDSCPFGCITASAVAMSAASATTASASSASTSANGDLVADAAGNLLGTTSGDGAYGNGTVFKIEKAADGYATSPTTLVSFNGTDGANPAAGLLIDDAGNLLGTTSGGGAYDKGTVFKIEKTPDGYAGTPTVLVSFNGTDGATPRAGLIADDAGNLFGTTYEGGTYGAGTVFEIRRINDIYATAPTVLISFNPTNGTDGANPRGKLLADADGNLFGTTEQGGLVVAPLCQSGCGTVFEVTGSASAAFAGTPGQTSCHGESVSALAKQNHGIHRAAAALGYSSVRELQNAIAAYCAA